jgi:alkylresorcinol/alkylpyrone synthase
MNAPRLISIATALPPHVVRQQDASALAQVLFSDVIGEDRRLVDVFRNTSIHTRHLCMPLDWFASDHDFAERNALYVEHAIALAAQAAAKTLAQVGMTARDVDHLVFVSTTGLATPSIDARLANAMGFRGDFRRTPVWGLGCAGGAAGLARARDFALADPEARVLLVALELCSLTFQRNDLSRRNFVASSLFADGAAAALIAGTRAPVPERDGTRPLALLASRSVLWPDTLDVMGWEVDGAGLHVVFSRDIPTIVRDRVRPSLEAFLDDQGLALGALDHLVTHPGGTKVLEAYRETLGRPPQSFRHARDVLAACGNMSSPTCLFVLERFLRSGDIGANETAVVAALGPGFSSEYVLARGL